MSRGHIFPIRVGISYNFGLMGEDFSRRALKSGEVPKIFISTSGFNYIYNSDGPKVLKKRLRIEFREEEKERIKEYFNDLVEDSWNKMESFFGSYGISLPEKGKVSESFSKSFIDYLKGITSLFNEIFDKYGEIVSGKKSFPLLSNEITGLASEASNSCLYSINIKDPDDPYLYLSFSDVKEALEMDNEETHPLKRLEKINLTKEDLDYLEKGDLGEGENPDNSITEDKIEKLKKKSKEVRKILEDLAEAVLYGDGFLYFDSQSIDEVVHIALSMGGRFYSLFPRVDTVEEPGGKEEFLVATNIVDRTTFSPEGQEITFPAVIVSIETSAKRENGKEVKLTYEGERETREVGPIRVGFGFLIELSNIILEREYGNPFYEDEIIESIEFYPNKEEKPVIVENYSLYYVYLRTKVNFKSGAMWCPASFSYLRMEEKERFSEMLDEVTVRVPKIYFTSLLFSSPESKDLDLDRFMDIYKPLLGKSKPEIRLLIENLLPQDSLVTSIVSSYLGFVESKKADNIRPTFGFYNGKMYDKERWMESLIEHNLVPIAVLIPKERIKDSEEREEKSDKKLIISDLELYKYLMSNSGVIGKRTLYPFLRTVIAEKYLSKGKSDLCFSQGEEIRVKLTPRSWEEVEEEIKRHLPFKKLDEVEPWEYRSENLVEYSKDETLNFLNAKYVYFFEKTKLAVNCKEKVKEKTRKGLFLAMSWSAQTDIEEIGDVEKIRRKLFGE